MKYLLLSALIFTSMAFAQDGPAKKDESKKEEVKKDEAVDVEKTASRIAENAQKAGERLKGKDTGTDTRKLQQDILKDIDVLLRQAQQPPPPSPPMMMDMNPMMPPPPMKDMNPMMNMNMGGMSGMPMMKMPMGMGGMSGMMPMGMNMGMGTPPMPKPMGMGMSGGQPDQQPQGQQGSGRRPKRDRKSGNDEGPMPMMPKGMNEPLPKGMNDMPPTPGKIDPKDGMGAKKDMGDGDSFGKGPPKRKDDSQFADLYKNVWGHLPDRLRQEMDLYYRDQFMPRYSELLRQYYAAIAEQKKKGEGDR